MNCSSPECDVTDQLNPKAAVYFQSCIRILHWIIELGRIDICTETLMLASHLVLPCKSHLQQIYQIFAYLKKHHNAELVDNQSYPNVELKQDFAKGDWSENRGVILHLCLQYLGSSNVLPNFNFNACWHQ